MVSTSAPFLELRFVPIIFCLNKSPLYILTLAYNNQNINTLADKTLDRISFASIKRPFEYPDFLDIQLKSFHDFFQLDTNPDNRKNEGLFKVFQENFPITDARNNFVLEFLDYYIDAPQYTIAECIERGLSYCVRLKAKLKLTGIAGGFLFRTTTVVQNHS